MYENPSAGKFDPPPPPIDPNASQPVSKRWWYVALLFLTGYPASYWLLHYRGRGGVSLLAALAALLLTAVHYALQRKAHVDRGGGDPFTPPAHLTR